MVSSMEKSHFYIYHERRPYNHIVDAMVGVGSEMLPNSFTMFRKLEDSVGKEYQHAKLSYTDTTLVLGNVCDGRKPLNKTITK